MQPLLPSDLLLDVNLPEGSFYRLQSAGFSTLSWVFFLRKGGSKFFPELFFYTVAKKVKAETPPSQPFIPVTSFLTADLRRYRWAVSSPGTLHIGQNHFNSSISHLIAVNFAPLSTSIVKTPKKKKNLFLQYFGFLTSNHLSALNPPVYFTLFSLQMIILRKVAVLRVPEGHGNLLLRLVQLLPVNSCKVALAF